MNSGFSIDTVTLGPGELVLSSLPGLAGDLESDLDTIADLRPDLVVSLTEPAEMKALGAGRLSKRLGQRALSGIAFPVPDYGTPPGSADWPSVSRRIHPLLDRGGRVWVHCRGGLGRSGMVALRLMIERGENPDSALSRLRAARPGAVETEAQHLWAISPPAS